MSDATISWGEVERYSQHRSFELLSRRAVCHPGAVLHAARDSCRFHDKVSKFVFANKTDAEVMNAVVKVTLVKAWLQIGLCTLEAASLIPLEEQQGDTTMGQNLTAPMIKLRAVRERSAKALARSLSPAGRKMAQHLSWYHHKPVVSGDAVCHVQGLSDPDPLWCNIQFLS